MTFLAQIVVYPFLALLCAGLFFMHVSLRSKVSFVSLLSISLLIAWRIVAHWAIELYLDMTRDPGAQVPFHHIGTFSAHVTFDMIDGIVSFVLLAIFCLSFFLSAISIPERQASHLLPRPPGNRFITSTSTKSLWVSAVLALALSLFGTICYYQLAVSGGSIILGAIATAIAIIGIASCMVLAGFATRRIIAESRRA